MRTTAIASDKVNCLSIRMDEVPGLDTSLVAKVHTMLSDKSIGIRNDRRYFFAGVSKHGSEVSKVPMKYTGILILQFANLGLVCMTVIKINSLLSVHY